MSQDHYVYVYFNPLMEGHYEIENRSYNYKPFYVGCGRDERIYDHLSEAKQKKYSKNSFYNWHKIFTIRKILKCNKTPIIVKIKDSLTCEDAKKLEVKIIGELGNTYDKTGILTNLTKGGDGTAGVDHKGEFNPMYGKKGKYNSNSYKYIAKINNDFIEFYGGNEKKEFIKKHNLSGSNFQQLVDGDKKHHRYIQIRRFERNSVVNNLDINFLSYEQMKKISLLEEKRLCNIRKTSNRRIKMTILSPDGNEYITDNFSKFCKNNGITRCYLREVAQGKREHFLGWKCRYLE